MDEEGQNMANRGNILQRVGSVSALSRVIQERERVIKEKKEKEKEDDTDESDIDTPEETEERKTAELTKKMNMKQEGPFLVPQLWKDTLSLENITNDFLESNVTGEVMNLDDFLKELQVNELVQQNDELQRGNSSNQMTSSQGASGHHMGASHQTNQSGHPSMQDHDQRFQSLIRPANIESLKEPSHPVRPSIMHQVGKPSQHIHSMQQGSHMPEQHKQEGLHIPNRGSVDSRGFMGSHGASMMSPKEHHVGQTGIPQASVRPLVRPVLMNQHQHELSNGSEDIKPPSSKKMRKISEQDDSEDDDDDEEEETNVNQNNFGGFTSTVCVNFSEDDLRLATIPGQEGDFDPATRRFSEEELKPQPIIRKRKKQFVPDELKNNKYWAKRCKNNEAAKRSREARRLKENQIAMRARFLEEENNALKGEVDHLKKENTDLKNMMLALEEKLNHMVSESH